MIETSKRIRKWSGRARISMICSSILRLNKSARPERREMRTALQSSQDQERHRPENNNGDGETSKKTENGPAAQDTKDTAKEGAER